MTVTVGTLRPAFGQGEELIAHIEEGHTEPHRVCRRLMFFS